MKSSIFVLVVLLASFYGWCIFCAMDRDSEILPEQYCELKLMMKEYPDLKFDIMSDLRYNHKITKSDFDRLKKRFDNRLYDPVEEFNQKTKHCDSQ